jgi:hypothetical protein
MATVKIEIPDSQLPRIRAAFIERAMNNPIGHPDFDPDKVTNKDALAMLEAELRDAVRGIVASHEQSKAMRAAEAGVDVSGLVVEPK